MEVLALIIASYLAKVAKSRLNTGKNLVLIFFKILSVRQSSGCAIVSEVA